MKASRRPASPFRTSPWSERVATQVAPVTVAAVAVALPLVPSEAVSSGSTILLNLVVFGGLVVWAATRLLPGQRAFTLHGSAVDIGLGLFFVWFAGSAARMIDTAHGRPAINVTWAWLAGGVLWFLARQSLRSPRRLRALAAVLCAVAAGLASYSFYQCGYQMPRDRAAFRRDPEAVLREAGVIAPEGSPIREQFRNRVESREPIATFALTNSLAGYLLPALVICFAGAATLRRKPVGSGSERVDYERRGGLVWLVAAAAIASCLLLTKSRSGYVATLFAVGALGWNWLRGGERIGWKLPAAAVGGISGLALIAAKLGLLDIQVLSEARLSLGYRWEYWTSTVAMVRDFPLTGCGAGNFQSYYTAYKLPQASEVVADPHNFLFELAALAGLPALALWLAAFVLWLLAIGRTPRTRKEDEPHSDRAGDSAAADAAESANPVWLGAGLGLPLATIAGTLAGYPPSFALIVTGVLPAITLLLWLRPWVRDGELPPFALSIATLAVLVNWLAAGGIGFPAVATGWWLVGAMALNAVEVATLRTSTRLGRMSAGSPVVPGTPIPPASPSQPASPASPSLPASRSKPASPALPASPVSLASPVSPASPMATPRWLWGILFASAALLVLIFHGTCFRPVFESQTRLAAAAVAGERGDGPAMFAELQAAADADPWSAVAWIQLASLRQRQWLEGVSASEQSASEQSASEQSAREQSAREPFERAVLEALRRDRRAHALRRELGDMFFEAYSKTGDRAALGDAVALYGDAISLYPNYAPHHAQLAWALRAAGDRKASFAAASVALRLDSQNPHREQKLAAQRLTTFPSPSSAGPEPFNARECVELIERENLESN